jgi:glycosyltransferase involved in cell wall biosynthesis
VADIVIWGPVQYSHTYEFFTEMKNKHGKLTLVDMDDNYVDIPPWNEAFHSYGPNSQHRRIALQSVQMADGVIVSTPHLVDLYGKFNDNIHLVQNSLDFKGDSTFIGWDKASIRKHKGLRIGWIGARSHFADLDMISPALKKVLARHPEIQLWFVNSAYKQSYEELQRPYPFEGMNNVCMADRSVPINRYARFYGHFGFDIGLAPLVDCNFNRSKSNLRWLESSAMKIPCVASDISHFSQTVRNGEDGLLVKPNDLDHWETNLELLIADTAFREQIGRAAGKRVRKDFNVKKNAAVYFRLLKKLLNTTVMGSEEETLLEVA